MEPLRFTIYGAPRTKKNSPQVVTKGRVRVLPSKAWTKWVKTALVVGLADTEIARAAAMGPEYKVNVKVFDQPYNIAAMFYRDALRGDAVGYYQGLADLLEKRGIITNDKQLVSWDGSRLLKDRDHPRVEIELMPCHE